MKKYSEKLEEYKRKLEVYKAQEEVEERALYEKLKEKFDDR